MGLLDSLTAGFADPKVQTALAEGAVAQRKKNIMIALVVAAAVGLFFFLKRRR